MYMLGLGNKDLQVERHKKPAVQAKTEEEPPNGRFELA